MFSFGLYYSIDRIQSKLVVCYLSFANLPFILSVGYAVKGRINQHKSPSKAQMWCCVHDVCCGLLYKTWLILLRTPACPTLSCKIVLANFWIWANTQLLYKLPQSRQAAITQNRIQTNILSCCRKNSTMTATEFYCMAAMWFGLYSSILIPQTRSE